MRFHEMRECKGCGEQFETIYDWDAHEPEATIKVKGASEDKDDVCPNCGTQITKRSTKRIEILD